MGIDAGSVQSAKYQKEGSALQPLEQRVGYYRESFAVRCLCLVCLCLAGCLLAASHAAKPMQSMHRLV